MSSIADHYENLLADHYSWLFGGLQQKVEENKTFFRTHGITPGVNRTAVDLGCGSGFQSLALAQSGFRVTAVDLSPKLLAELAAHTTGLDIRTVHDDLLRFPFHLKGPMELCVCMGDTLTHIDSTWIFNKSFFWKVRIPLKWTTEKLLKVGLQVHLATLEKGLITVIAFK